MSWAMHHSQSEHYASLAELAIQERDFNRAAELYRQAAAAEVLALADLDKTKVRTLGITAVSAASLWYKAHEFREAQSIAHNWLASNVLPPFANEQLQNLLQTIWSEEIREQSGIKFTRGEVLISVSGGEVIIGGAPLDLILHKVDEVRGLFYRTVELLLELPLRKRGAPSLEIQQQCRPWLFQAPPGSYQFAVRVQQPDQLNFWPEAVPKVEQVTQKFLEIVRASAQDPEHELEIVVPDPDYRETFLKLTRNLAPTGKTFSQIEIKSASEPEPRPIIFVPSSRDAINQVLKKPESTRQETADVKIIQLYGVLRALDLNKDRLEININGEENQKVTVFEAGDIIDDVVGPMVNRRVIIDVLLKAGKHIFRDIQTEE